MPKIIWFHVIVRFSLLIILYIGELQALKGGVRERVELATKFGISFANGNKEIHGDPANVRAACEASLKRLDILCIDLYYQHCVDNRIPIEVTVRYFLPLALNFFYSFCLLSSYQSDHPGYIMAMYL